MRLISSVIIVYIFIYIFILTFYIYVYIFSDRPNLSSHSLEMSDDKKMNANPKNWSICQGVLIRNFEEEKRIKKSFGCVFD